MAIKRDQRYPGRWTPANADFPLGGPKNRTTSTSQDGSYFDREWIADYEAFYQRLMSEAGIAANGSSDTAPTSQFYNALIVESTKATVAWWNTVPKGTAFNKDFGSGVGQVCEGNDPRLSDAREWLANTVSQAEAEAGESVTPRKWTAQRVHQAFKKFGIGVAAYNSVQVVNLLTLKTSGRYIVSQASQNLPVGYNGSIVDVLGYRNGEEALQTIHQFSYVANGQAPIPKITYRIINSDNSHVDAQAYHSMNMPAATSSDAQGNDDKLLAWSPQKIRQLSQTVSIGYNQVWQDVKSIRSVGVNYTNNTGKPIQVNIYAKGEPTHNIDMYVNNIRVALTNAVGDGRAAGVSLIIPVGSFYRLQNVSGADYYWLELR